MYSFALSQFPIPLIVSLLFSFFLFSPKGVFLFLFLERDGWADGSLIFGFLFPYFIKLEFVLYYYLDDP